MIKKAIITALSTLLFVGVAQASLTEPNDCPKDIKYALGFYYGNGEQFVLRENGGELELLYRYNREDYKFNRSNIYPMTKKSFDSYYLYESGPMHSTEAPVRLERNLGGYVITCNVGGNRYTRGFFYGDGMEKFKFPQPADWDALRAAAGEAQVPAALAGGKTAVLADVKTEIPDVMLDLRYSGDNNCFGTPLTTLQNAYLDVEAIEALKLAKDELAEYGYGLIVWEAYRPWAAAKLASDALPANRKDMLPNPMTDGYSHCTGRVIDVSLYYLDNGMPVEMISDFDEPTIRQYASFGGGTALQRYQRDLLKFCMNNAGFYSTEMEWWHFEYGSPKEYAQLNVLP